MPTGTTQTFVLALIVVVGSLAYFITRGGGDPVIMPILSGALGTVLSFFFAQHLSNGAATSAVNSAMAAQAAQQTAADHATAAAGGKIP